jgi:hypothetical protein
MKRLGEAWNRFFFEPAGLASLALFRAALGLIAAIRLLLLLPNREQFFGTNAIILRSSVIRMVPEPRIDLMMLLPSGEPFLALFLIVGIIAAVLVSLGRFTRSSLVVLYLVTVSTQNHCPVIHNNGDTLLRIMTVLLIVSPAGECWSLDALRRRARGGAPDCERPPWVQRLMQIQVSVFYLGSVIWKLQGKPWRDGSAVYYVLRLEGFQRFPTGLENQIEILRLLTWATLVIELALATLIWVRPLRKYVLIAGLGLHLGLEYAMNIQIFQWMSMSTYLLFLEEGTARRIWLLGRRERGESQSLEEGGIVPLRSGVPHAPVKLAHTRVLEE